MARLAAVDPLLVTSRLDKWPQSMKDKPLIRATYGETEPHEEPANVYPQKQVCGQTQNLGTTLHSEWAIHILSICLSYLTLKKDRKLSTSPPKITTPFEQLISYGLKVKLLSQPLFAFG